MKLIRRRVGNGFFAVAHAVRFRIDGVGKIAGVTCEYSWAAAGDFAHPTDLAKIVGH